MNFFTLLIPVAKTLDVEESTRSRINAVVEQGITNVGEATAYILRKFELIKQQLLTRFVSNSNVPMKAEEDFKEELDPEAFADALNKLVEKMETDKEMTTAEDLNEIIKEEIAKKDDEDVENDKTETTKPNEEL
ncbi:hypothetical protein ECANGB1_1394 [Enterospora canceri]|uniref:Uncharacterized protein n=1 Tax=Enterospora canceri TaxID=1081671 RepID=A0A1Y1S7C4_9MICR|nr:hypothetical protein ECANGB1_1394 [Enterospora canceri]